MSLKHQRKAPHQQRAKGNQPAPPNRWHSKTIMQFAGQLGMLSVRLSRWICGYRHKTPSKYEPHQGARERSRG